MKLSNFITFLPNSFLTVILRTIRTNLSSDISNYVVNNGLYHVVPNKEVGNKILKSGHIRSSSAIASYGIPSAFMFAGVPELDHYIQNAMFNGNILLNPNIIVDAVKFEPYANELGNFKLRLQDNSVLHEGTCIIPPNRCKLTQLVLDLVKDKNNNEILGFRERTSEEIANNSEYIPSDACKQAIELELQKHGYLKNDILNIGNSINTVLHSSSEIDLNGNKNTIKNTFSIFSKWFRNLGKKQLDENPNTKVHNIIEKIGNGQLSTKLPVLSKSYVNTILNLNKEQIYQKNIENTLPKMLENQTFKYFSKKLDTINTDCIKENGIHGISHNNRVATLALSIAELSGINLDNKSLDLLINACYYHDIGRILDIGPHAKRSTMLVDKLHLTYANGEFYSNEDMNVLKAVIESHEGSDKKLASIMNKHNISDEHKEICTILSTILKDADALDRARLSNKYHMALNQKYLRLPASKGLINFAFELETLTKKVPNFRSILSYDRNIEISKLSHNVPNKFVEELQRQTTLTPLERTSKENIIEEKENEI